MAGTLMAAVLFFSIVRADDGQVRVTLADANALIQIRGDADDDWRLQVSTDLTHWATLTNFGTLLSGGAKAPQRALGSPAAPRAFYRALKTGGLYDSSLLRTISLTFTQANWQTQLANGRTRGTNAYCSLLTMDNGATNVGVGARYRGNTSYTGMGGTVPAKKSINLDLDFTITNADLMGYRTINLNNAFQDETVLREPLYFNVMRHYTVCPAGCLAQLYINGANWGVYSQAQQENGDLIREYFPSNEGDRWRAPNMPAGGGGPGSAGSAVSALGYLGTTNVASYANNYELKSDYNTNAWPRLVRAIYVLNTTTANQLRDKVEDVLAVDRWLWFLALENVFTDDDSYWNKGADYMMYFEPESGRLHPVEHDGNEAFVVGDASLSPVQGAAGTTRPVLSRLLAIAELRQRYLAHLGTVLEEFYNPPVMNGLINQLVAVRAAAIAADPKKGFTMTAYTNDLNALRTFISNRHRFLTNHVELTPVPPAIAAVYAPYAAPTATETPFLTAEVHARGTNGLDSVWLYYRGKSYGRFAAVQMFDDGDHGDGAAGDGLFGAATTNYPAGTRVRLYVEARSANAAKAACFAPPRAEQETYSYRVALTTAPQTPVVINELMADNQAALADPQGEYDDWIELHNVTTTEVDLTGHYLSDEPNNPRKWQFPAGTVIPPDGYLLVWADEDGSATSGLHASFRLAKEGEELFLTDTDANFNAVLDHVAFGPQPPDLSYGRTAADEDVWSVMEPTPGAQNR